MSKKRTYKTVDVKHVDMMRLLALLPATVVIAAIDVAKYKQVVTLAAPQGQAAVLVRFTSPQETEAFLKLLEGLKRAGKEVQVAVEPTGTYGDALCYQVHGRGIDVYQLSPKKTHDAAELFDGVPSQHDAKDSTVLARLHAQGLSRMWSPRTDQRRELQALMSKREMYAQSQERGFGKLEGLMARHWPEFGQYLDVREQRCALELLATNPNPAKWEPQQMEQQLRQGSRGRLRDDKIAGVVHSAARTTGVPMLPAEHELVREVAAEVLRQDDELRRVDKQVREAVARDEQARPLCTMLGGVTTAVLIAQVGAPQSYDSVGALEKAMGLNLRESSSGQRANQGIHITKRGPGMVRKYLYLAAMRWVITDEVARAWYQQRGGYTEQAKMKAMVALMRKLVKALWQVARGQPYRADKLFDVRRLTALAAPTM